MPTATEAATERRDLKATQIGASPPIEQEHLPCPRCESTNTKFCYYNNYNYSQPRHFCKSCRRYWTHGGTLRDIPVGGGTRKNSAKRSRTLHSSCGPASISPALTTSTAAGLTTSGISSLGLTGGGNGNVSTCSVVDPIPAGGPIFVSLPGTIGPFGPYLSEVQFSKQHGGASGPMGGSFTSLLGTGNGASAAAAGLLAFGGFGLGLGHGFEDTAGLLGRAGVWPFPDVDYFSGNGAAATNHGGGGGGSVNSNNKGGCSGGEGGFNGNAWHLESGTDTGFVGGDSISWPELAISTPGNGVK